MQLQDGDNVDPEEIMKLLDVARDHEDKIVRMQANIRGFLQRKK